MKLKQILLTCCLTASNTYGLYEPRTETNQVYNYSTGEQSEATTSTDIWGNKNTTIYNYNTGKTKEINTDNQGNVEVYEY